MGLIVCVYSPFVVCNEVFAASCSSRRVLVGKLNWWLISQFNDKDYKGRLIHCLVHQSPWKCL